MAPMIMLKTLHGENMGNEYRTPILEEPLLRKPAPWKALYHQMCAVGAASLNALSMGFVLGYSSPALPELVKQGYLSQEEGSWYASLAPLGAMLGGPFGGYLADAVGRKTSLMLNVIPYAIGWLMNICSHQLWCLFIGRTLAGIGVGITTQSVPVYISEIASPKWRGRFGFAFQIFLTFGILLPNALGLHLNWSWLSVIGIGLTVITVILITYIPETPRWLSRQKRYDEAKRTFTKLREEEHDTDTALEFSRISGCIDDATHVKFKLADLSEPIMYKPFLISIFMMFSVQLSGIQAVILYTNKIFDDAGYQGNSGLPTVLVGCLMLLVSFIIMLVVDRVGRRALLLTSGSIMAVSSALFGLYYYLHTTKIIWLSVASLGLFLAGFCVGWGPLQFAVISEILPATGYGFTSGICIALNWILAFLVSKEFTAMEQYFTEFAVFWFFSTVCMVGVIGVYKFLPETRGRTLSQITLSFSSRSTNDSNRYNSL